MSGCEVRRVLQRVVGLHVNCGREGVQLCLHALALGSLASCAQPICRFSRFVSCSEAVSCGWPRCLTPCPSQPVSRLRPNPRTGHEEQAAGPQEAIHRASPLSLESDVRAWVKPVERELDPVHLDRNSRCDPRLPRPLLPTDLRRRRPVGPCQVAPALEFWMVVGGDATGLPRAAVVARGCPGASAELCLSEKRRCYGRPSC
jgi:hypothetical protein